MKRKSLVVRSKIIPRDFLYCIVADEKEARCFNFAQNKKAAHIRVLLLLVRWKVSDTRKMQGTAAEFSAGGTYAGSTAVLCESQTRKSPLLLFCIKQKSSTLLCTALIGALEGK